MRQSWADRYGPWAVVTGASSGLGEAFAHQVAARGVHPLLVARRDDELVRVSEDIEGRHGIACQRLAVDLGDRDFVARVLDMTKDKHVGLVIGNAGFNPPGAFADLDRASLERVLDVNVRANVLLAEAFVPAMVAGGSGGLLLVASVEGYFGMPYSTSYAASKAFVLSFAEGLWGELHRSGVDVLALVPGPIDTPLFRSRQVRAPALSPERTAQRGLAHLDRGPSFVPGHWDRWLWRVLRALPRRTGVRLMGRAMGRMVQRLRRDGNLHPHDAAGVR
jgi:hypothetical protein